MLVTHFEMKIVHRNMKKSKKKCKWRLFSFFFSIKTPFSQQTFEHGTSKRGKKYQSWQNFSFLRNVKGRFCTNPVCVVPNLIALVKITLEKHM